MSFASFFSKGRSRLATALALVLALLLTACGTAPDLGTPLAASQNVETTEDVAVAVTLTTEDPDGGDVVYSVITGPQHGTLSGTAPNLTYTPDTSFLGRDAFTFTASSGSRVSREATVTIDVLNTPFYAITRGAASSGTPEEDITSLLYRIDERGRLHLIGDTGHALVTIRVDPTDGTLYAATRQRDVAAGRCDACLVTLDTTTGAATVVGPIDLDGDPLTVDRVSNLVFTSDGTLYGFANDLVIIDKATGTGTVPGATGISNYADGMWADENDVLWFINGNGDVYTIDPTTGAETLVYEGEALAASAGTPQISDFQVRGDRDPATGKYWGVSPAYGYVVATGVIRMMIDADTAAFIDIANMETIAGMHYIAFVR